MCAYPPETPWQTVAPHACLLGESPFWHPQEQTLYWLDIAGKQILRSNIYMGTVETWDMPSEPGCMAPAQGGGLVIALRHGVFRAHNWGGVLTLLAKLAYDPTRMRANDGKCDTLGRFWVGTIDETRTAKNAALYCVDARSAVNGGVPLVTEKISPSAGMTTANGLAWSPDNCTLYWANTPSHTVWAWDFDSTSASMANQRVFASFAPKPPCWLPNPSAPDNGGYGGRPDGAAVDVQGNYWVALYEGRRVCQFAPNGTLLASLTVPLQSPTMPCFGGEDLKTLYLTSAGHHSSAPELTAYPLTGEVLSLRVDVPGLPVNFFVPSAV
ncbi:MAG: SMP-30/gluconolactonase/LRE family protein [Rhodoferax sp.]|nr:SMP-30/gluconolactonase/LRE family protein [Rhodoferax sp.]OIP21567.1 MAG: gluconolactonase [Comamonadaceae bacterium CG2_30_60_41]PIW09557.1 MAG: gluconolactonase [Comamonadaceae bacterium CG17_big_fil_post_rev_8_21_14_2_50_60_13]PIY26737.1 MAG: gluconolactonase [Comamonadaceae bacterium CG_4_10_14_3_um_filter_60_75]PJC11832.1 MAG: gluconolactonase [Comamonadaceae bacterium CG_4_9_14_0_8_um_filter_60_18]